MTSKELELVRRWFEDAVLGLGLCPFAGEPWQAGRIRMTVSHAETDHTLLEDLHGELIRLETADPTDVETTILIVAHWLQDFGEYNQFLNLAEALIDEFNWSEQFQIASFHPDYHFADTDVDDVSNLTNRSPYPLLHLLRESSVSRAIENHPDTRLIPDKNIATLRALSEERRRAIFHFLYER